MNRRFATIIAPLALAILLQGAAWPASSNAAAADPARQSNAEDSQALKTAQIKLAQLAREGGAIANPKASATNRPVAATKKKVISGARPKTKKIAVKAKGERILDRRMTLAEVQGVLSTTRDFSGTDLSGLNLVGADLRGVKFNRANLQSANLVRADLAETDLELADLTGADLRGASLNQARLRGTRMAGAKMEGAIWIDRTICGDGSIGSCIE